MIKVFANFGYHPIYETFYTDPPKNIVFICRSKNITKFSDLYIYRSKRYSILKRIYIKIQRILKFIRYWFVGKTNADYVWGSRGFVPITNKPFIIDIEHPASFISMENQHLLLNHFVRIQILKALKDAKYIFPHCNATKKVMMLYTQHYWKKIKDKTYTLYPVIKLHRDKPKSLSNTEIKLVFIGRLFFFKGGREVLESSIELSKKYDIKLYLITELPKIYEKKIRKYDFIIYHSFLPKKKVFHILSHSDILVHPSYFDTFGYVLLEAMSFGLPIVASNHYAIPEIVKDSYNGFLINTEKYNIYTTNNVVGRWHLSSILHKNKKEIVKQIVDKLSMLIEDTKLYREISKNNINEIKYGKFSIERRNSLLEELLIKE